MVVSLWVGLYRGWLYTRRQYLDLLAEVAKTEKVRDERIADLKETVAMLREANRLREEERAILISGRQP